MYNKLFSKIVDSSIWLEPTPTRIVWVMFIAIMDESGFVEIASPANVAHKARISEEDAQKALAVLEGPDENSANQENEGRRIERVEGGWMVLNAPLYRSLVTREIAKEQTRRRVAKHRAEKRAVADRVISGQRTCDCCHQPFEEPYSKFVVLDHDHKTGKERGLICQSCNKVVGFFETDSTYAGPKRDLASAYIAKCNAPVTQRNASVTPSEAEAEVQSETKDVGAKGSPPATKRNLSNGLLDSEWIAHLKQNPAYKGIDVDSELGKMAEWCAVNNKQPNRRRFVNWLNRADKPMTTTSSRQRSFSAEKPIDPSAIELSNVFRTWAIETFEDRRDEIAAWKTWGDVSEEMRRQWRKVLKSKLTEKIHAG